MKRGLRKILNIGILRGLVDTFLSVLLLFASFPFWLFSRVGPSVLPRCLSVLRWIGLYPIRDHYYEPLFNPAHLRAPLDVPRGLSGIDWNTQGQIDFVRGLDAVGELVSLDLKNTPNSVSGFHTANDSFSSGDADFLYQFIRKVKPSRVFEVGSGESTKVVSLALLKNFQDSGREPQHLCVEPFEAPWLESLGVEVVRSRVELLDPLMFKQLQSGDLLFIDSSHIIRPQGDVLYEFLEVLPILNSGVFVHIHDVFSPRDYPDTWIRDKVRMWNEQYLLEALLSDSKRYEIIAALNYLKHTAWEDLARVCPYLTRDREPGSFYIRVT